MNINELLPEMIIKIFSHLPQSQLFSSIVFVCNKWSQLAKSPLLWKNIQYSTVFGNSVEGFEYLNKVQKYVKSLTIKPEDMNTYLTRQRELQFINLKTLLIERTAIDSEMLFDKIIQGCPKIKHIKFIANDGVILQRCLVKLANLNLVELLIEYSYGKLALDENLITLVKQQSRLKKLELRGWVELGDKTFGDIFNEFPNLTSLNLHNTSISSDAFRGLQKPNNLRRLTVVPNIINDDDLQNITSRSKHLHYLNIRSISNKGLELLSNNCPLLEGLVIRQISPICDDQQNMGLILFFMRYPKLKEFSISSTTSNVYDCDITALAESCRGLTSLILHDCAQLTDSSLFALAEHSSVLKQAVFTKCLKFSGYGVYSLIKSCKTLDSLTLIACTGISFMSDASHSSDTSAQNINQQCESRRNQNTHSHLRGLNIQSCDNVRRDTILAFLSLCPDLVYLVLPSRTFINNVIFKQRVLSMCKCLKDIVYK